MEKNSSKIIRITCVIICAVFIFLSGFLVAKFARSAASRSLDWIIKTINENYYKDVEEEKIVKYALSGGLDKLLDVYSDYYTAEEYKALLADNAGSKTGVGISYTFVEGKGVLINSVVGNSPAYISGLRKGLFIEYGINGKGEKTAFNAIDDFSKFAAATADNEKITLHASDGKDYTMAKASYTASYAYMCTNSSSWTFKS